MKVLSRVMIIFFWVLLIFGCLYVPKLGLFPFEEKSINIFTWGDTLHPDVLAEFEKKTGIKIHINYYSSNEELLVKLRATEGRGYDLILPSDYGIEKLIKEKLIQPLDRSKLQFWTDLNPRLLNLYYDPENAYSIPFEWEVYGFGINRDDFKNRPLNPSWSLIFDAETIDYKIAMMNEPREAINFAAFYLFGKNDPLSPDKFDQVGQLLLNQRPFITAYASFRADYFLATKNCSVAVATTAFIWRSLDSFKFTDFVIPEEGTFITIENFAIPKPSRKTKYVYEFLNYLYSKKSLIKHYEDLGFLPATLSSIESVQLRSYEEKIVEYSETSFDKFHFTRTLYPQNKVRELWVEVKSF